MAQTTLEVFDETRITYKGKNPDLKISCEKEDEKGIEINVIVNLKRHEFDDDCDVFFQTYDNRGAAMNPRNMGKIKVLNTKEENEFVYYIPGITKDDARFRMLVSKDGNFKKNAVKRLVGKAEIPGFDEKNENTKVKIESLLPTFEKDIGTAFQIDMSPNRSPYLVLKKGCNIKYNLDLNIDPIQKTLIYTSAIRTVIETYLTDTRYEDCIYKKKWLQVISEKTGEEITEFPTSLLSTEDDKVSIELTTQRWIETVTETMVSNLIDQNGKKLIEKFKDKNFRAEQSKFDEEEDI